MKATNEMFIIAFENVIIPVMDKIMESDRIEVSEMRNDFCRSEAEFIKFRGAFEQRIRLFYFRKFSEYKKKGMEKLFPDDIENLEKDIQFMHMEFKSFLLKQRSRMEK